VKLEKIAEALQAKSDSLSAAKQEVKDAFERGMSSVSRYLDEGDDILPAKIHDYVQKNTLIHAKSLSEAQVMDLSMTLLDFIPLRIPNALGSSQEAQKRFIEGQLAVLVPFVRQSAFSALAELQAEPIAKAPSLSYQEIHNIYTCVIPEDNQKALRSSQINALRQLVIQHFDAGFYAVRPSRLYEEGTAENSVLLSFVDKNDKEGSIEVLLEGDDFITKILAEVYYHLLGSKLFDYPNYSFLPYDQAEEIALTAYAYGVHAHLKEHIPNVVRGLP